MPYKNEYKRKQVARESMARKRGLTLGVNNEGLTPQGLTQYPAIVHALANPGQRAALRAICQSLGSKGLLKEVRYGVSGPTMDVVAEMVECLRP